MYLPLLIARYNKHIFGSPFVAGLLAGSGLSTTVWSCPLHVNT
jgi:hypothetical protein